MKNNKVRISLITLPLCFCVFGCNKDVTNQKVSRSDEDIYKNIYKLTDESKIEEDLALYPAPQKFNQVKDKYVRITGKVCFDDQIEDNAKNKIVNVIGNYFDYTFEQSAKSDIRFKKDETIKKEGYKIDIDNLGIHVRYKDGSGAYYAGVALNQMFNQYGSILPYLSIYDYPDMSTRGFELDIARDKVPNLETLKGLVDDISALKYNTLLFNLHSAYCLQIDSISFGTKANVGLTLEEAKELTSYCKDNYIRIIPYINGLAHLNDFIEYPQMVELKETFTAGCETLTVQNPKSQEFIGNWISDVIEAFDCTEIFIPCDESVEVGTGQSIQYLPGATKEEVYLDSLKIVYRLADERGVVPVFSHDMLIKYFVSDRYAIRDAFKEMPNAKIGFWEYEEDSDYAEYSYFKRYNIPIVVCPSTDCFGSPAGRLSSAEKNLNLSVKKALDEGCNEIWTLSFGDGGQRNQLTAEYTALAYSSGLTWNYSANLNKTNEYLAYVNEYIFGADDFNLINAWVELQRNNDITGRSWGISWLNAFGNENYLENNWIKTYLKFQEGATVEEKCANSVEKFDKVIEVCDKFKEVLKVSSIHGKNAQMILDEMYISVENTRLLAEHAKFRFQLYGNLADPSQLKDHAREVYQDGIAFNDIYREVWHKYNKIGKIESSIAFLNTAISLAGYIGDAYGVPNDGNLFYLTPNDLETLDDKYFCKSFHWTNYGKNYPTICSIPSGVVNPTEFPVMFNDGSIRLIEHMDGVEGKTLVLDKGKMIDNYHFNYYYPDTTRNSYMFPTASYPGIFDGNGTYKIALKAKFDNDVSLQDNAKIDALVYTMEKGMETLYGTTEFSEPDKNGWVTVTWTFKNTQNFRYVSIGFNANQEYNRYVLNVADVKMTKEDY